MTLITFFNGNWGICYCLIKISLSLNSGNMSSNEACLFPGKCLRFNHLGRCKRTAGKRWKPQLSICFLEMFISAKSPQPKYQSAKSSVPKYQNAKLPVPAMYRSQDYNCPPRDPHFPLDVLKGTLKRHNFSRSVFH